MAKGGQNKVKNVQIEKTNVKLEGFQEQKTLTVRGVLANLWLHNTTCTKHL